MIGKLQCVVLDCADAGELSRFYQALLGGVLNQPDPRWSLSDGWATLHTEAGLVLAFQRVADHRPPRWPDPAHPQQSHLDVAVDDLAQAQKEVLGLGAPCSTTVTESAAGASSPIRRDTRSVSCGNDPPRQVRFGSRNDVPRITTAIAAQMDADTVIAVT